jgi:hypothetical protein
MRVCLDIFFCVYFLVSRICSSVDIATGWMTGVRFPTRQDIFLFSTGSRPALEPTQPSIQWVPRGFSLGVKRRSREAEHSLPSGAEVKNCGALPPLPHTH